MPIRSEPTPSSGAARPRSAAVAAERPPDAAPSRAATPATVVSRIVDAVRLRACSGSRIRIALSPEHLGELLIELTLRGTVLHGSVLAENDAARNLIASQLDRLREALEGQGIQVGDFQVSVHRPLQTPPPSFEAVKGIEEEAALPSIRRRLIDLLA